MADVNQLLDIYRGMKDGAEAIQSNFQVIFDMLYPVGKIIQADRDIRPNETLPGTWERIKGRVLVGVDEADADFNTAGKIGGVKTLDARATVGVVNGSLDTIGYDAVNPIPGIKYTRGISATKISESDINSANHATRVLQANGHELTTVQPYKTVYIWKRTA